MKKHNPSDPTSPNNNRNAIGAIVILFGVLLLFKNLDFDWFFPNWLFSWPTILIIIGLVIGVNSQFKKRSSFILMAIGTLFLLKKMFHADFGGYVLPIVVIILGAYLLSNRRDNFMPPPNFPTQDPDVDKEFDWDKRVDTQGNTVSNGNTDNNNNTHRGAPSGASSASFSSFEDYLRVDAIFANVKKNILSKRFRGGTITNVFGSTKVNLLQADIQETVRIDGFLLFGSAQIIVPSNWSVHTNVTSIFGDVDDRRDTNLVQQDPQKILLITGTSMFGSFTVKTI